MNLRYIMFTKHLEGLGIDEIIDGLTSVGVQGADPVSYTHLRAPET